MPHPPLLRGDPSFPPQNKGNESISPELLRGTINLQVTLPSGKITSLDVHSSTPMMDLLIQVTTTHHINPADHVIHVHSNQRTLTYKPSTPIGTLDTNAIEIVSKRKMKESAKAHDDNPRRNIRLKVNLPSNQLGVYRVPPTLLISEVHELVCQDKSLDTQAFEIRHPVNLDERLRCSCSLSDYQLQEVSLVPKNFHPPPLSASDLITMASISHHQEDRKRSSKGIRAFFSRKVKRLTDDTNYSGNGDDRNLSKSGNKLNQTPSNGVAMNKSSSNDQIPSTESLGTPTLEIASTSSKPSRPNSAIGLHPVKKRHAPPPPPKLAHSQITKLDLDGEEKENQTSREARVPSGNDSHVLAPRLEETNLVSTASSSTLSLSSSKGKRKAPQPPLKSLVKQSNIVIHEEGEHIDTSSSPEAEFHDLADQPRSLDEGKFSSVTEIKETDNHTSIPALSSHDTYPNNKDLQHNSADSCSYSSLNDQSPDCELEKHILETVPPRPPKDLPRKSSLPSDICDNVSSDQCSLASLSSRGSPNVVDNSKLESDINYKSAEDGLYPPKEDDVSVSKQESIADSSCGNDDISLENEPKNVKDGHLEGHMAASTPEPPKVQPALFQFISNSCPNSNNLQRKTGSLSSSSSNSSIGRTNLGYSSPSHTRGPESAYDSMSDAPREESSKSDCNSPFISPISTLSKDINSSISSTNIKEDCTGVYNPQVNLVIAPPVSKGEQLAISSTIDIEYSFFGETSTDEPAEEVLNANSSAMQNDSITHEKVTKQDSRSDFFEIKDLDPKQNVIDELKSNLNNDLKQTRDCNYSKSNYTVILSMDSKAQTSPELSSIKKSPSEQSFSSYSSVDDPKKILNATSIRKNLESDSNSSVSASSPVPDSSLPVSDLECEPQSSASSISLSASNSLERHRTSLSYNNSMSDLTRNPKKDSFVQSRQPIFSISTYKNRAEEISYDKKLARSESFNCVKKTRSVTSLNEIKADSRKTPNFYRLGRIESLRDVRYNQDNEYSFRGREAPLQRAPSPLYMESTPRSPVQKYSTFPFKSNEYKSPIIEEEPVRSTQKSSSRNPSSPLNFKIGVYEPHTKVLTNTAKDDALETIEPSKPSTSNPSTLQKVNFGFLMERPQSASDIRDAMAGQFPPGSNQNPLDTGLAQEYMKLQDDFMKWQQQLLQNQHILHSRVAPIASQPPMANNMGAFRDMMNPGSHLMPNLFNQMPQQDAPQRPVEINVPIRFEEESEPSYPPTSHNNNRPSPSQSSIRPNGESMPAVPEKGKFVVVTDPPQVFQAPTDPRLRPLFKGQPHSEQQSPKGTNSNEPYQTRYSSDVPDQQKPPAVINSPASFQSPASRFQPEPFKTDRIVEKVNPPSSGNFMDTQAARQAFWNETQNQNSPASKAPNQQRPPPKAADRWQTTPAQPTAGTNPRAPSHPVDTANGHFTSVALNNQNTKDNSTKDKIHSNTHAHIVNTEPQQSLNSATTGEPKTLQQSQTQQHPEKETMPSPGVQNARARPWSNRSAADERNQQTGGSFPGSNHPVSSPAPLPESITPMSSRLVQAVQQPNSLTGTTQSDFSPAVIQALPSKKIEPESSLPCDVRPPHLAHQLSNLSLHPAEAVAHPPEPILSKTQTVPANDVPAPPPCPPAPPPPPPPVRHTSTGKKIVPCQPQNQSDLDTRAELMMAIRNFGGSGNLRRSRGINPGPPME